ncbi:MAG: hypothetical protein KUG77_21375, partial [Nannocystaceae bacterium]|nr:hypothetical protein [Nannocystaceae bacterium]
MKNLWTSIPQGAVLVCTGVLAAGVPTAAVAGQSDPADAQAEDAAPATDGEVPEEAPYEAPTCGPCCHCLL